MPETQLTLVTLDPPGPHDATVFWLHGLGADGNDFVPAIPYLDLPEKHGIRFVFPTAIPIPVTINGGMVMPAWYDIRDLDLDAPERSDTDGLKGSVERVRRLIEEEVDAGVPSKRVVVAGFSQGGAVAFELALTHTTPFAGLVALSTYIVDRPRITRDRRDANAQLPILQCHGTYDPMVPVASGQSARDFVAGLGHDVAWHEYPIQHEVSAPELKRIGAFLTEALA